MMCEKEKVRDLFCLSTALEVPPGLSKEFQFIKRSGSVNWAEIVAADPDEIIKEKNIAPLKENLFNIINFDLNSASTSYILDPGFVKLFRMAQLTIEYLLYVQKYLRKTVNDLSEEEKDSREETPKQKKPEKAFDINEMKSISKTCTNFTKGSRMILLESDDSNIFPCSICGKVFLDTYYLTSHHKRRHGNLPYPALPEKARVTSTILSTLHHSSSNILLKETEKIRKELQLLREHIRGCDSCGKTKNSSEVGSEKGESSDDKEIVKEEEDKMEKSPAKFFPENSKTEDSCTHGAQKHVEEEGETRKDFDKILDVQERVWRGRVKKITDDNLLEVASLHDEISSLKDKEKALKKDYEDQIDKLTREKEELLKIQILPSSRGNEEQIVEVTSQPKEIIPRDANISSDDSLKQENCKEKLDAVISQLKTQADKPKFMPRYLMEKNSERTTPLSNKLFKRQTFEHLDEDTLTNKIDAECDDKSSEDLSASSNSVDSSAPVDETLEDSRDNHNVTFVSNHKEMGKISDSEMDSSNSSPSSIWRMGEEEDEGGDRREATIELLQQKLKRFGVNPTNKKISQRIFKDIMKMINLQQKDTAKNINGYFQIKSNIEEKALAKVSQKLQRHNSEISRNTSKTNCISLENDSREKWIDSPNFSASPIPKDESSSTLASRFRQKKRLNNPINPRAVINSSNKFTPWILGPKSNKQMGAITSSHVIIHPKVKESSLFPASSAYPAFNSTESQGSSPGGAGILRRVSTMQSTDKGDRIIRQSASFNSSAIKSVSFMLSR